MTLNISHLHLQPNADPSPSYCSISFSPRPFFKFSSHFLFYSFSSHICLLFCKNNTFILTINMGWFWADTPKPSATAAAVVTLPSSHPPTQPGATPPVKIYPFPWYPHTSRCVFNLVKIYPSVEPTNMPLLDSHHVRCTTRKTPQPHHSLHASTHPAQHHPHVR